MKTYEVSFTVTVPDRVKWKDAGWDTYKAEYKSIDPGRDQPDICVPGDAEIVLTSSTFEDGFYLSGTETVMYHRKNGNWYYWSSVNQAWMGSSYTDASVNNDLTRVLGLD